MPNRNGQGPKGSGSGSGRGRGLCNRTTQAGVVQHEAPQEQLTTEQQRLGTGCRGPRGCGTGKERRGNSINSGRGQR